MPFALIVEVKNINLLNSFILVLLPPRSSSLRKRNNTLITYMRLKNCSHYISFINKYLILINSILIDIYYGLTYAFNIQLKK